MKYILTQLLKKKRRAVADTKGFSLIELMVVIAIIAMLATAVGVSMFSALDDANVANAQQEISSFKTALIGYKIAFKKLPSTSEGLNALVNNSKKNFLSADAIPMDPWGNPYVYTLEGGNNFVIISYGADGVAGGSDLNADISSSNLAGNESK